MSWRQEEAQEQQERLEREISRRRARGEPLEPLPAPTGSKKLCTSFWGQAWSRHLEAFQYYEARLPAGRSYLRKGKVLDLDIAPGTVSAVVAGSMLYDTVLHIAPLDKHRWQEIVEKSQEQTHSLLDLLTGKLGEGLLRILTDPQEGLFPQPGEIRFDCTCPDHADLCKHAAAVLYGVGVLLDARPELLFRLRGVDQTDLLSSASTAAAEEIGSSSNGSLEGTDLSSLFGIDLAPETSVSQQPADERS